MGDKIMFLEKLKLLNSIFEEVESKLSDLSVISNQEEYRELTKQHFYLRPLAEKYIRDGPE